MVLIKAAQVLSMVLFTTVAPRLLGPSRFGELAVILSMSSLWQTACTLGGRYVFGRFIPEYAARGDSRRVRAVFMHVLETRLEAALVAVPLLHLLLRRSLPQASAVDEERRFRAVPRRAAEPARFARQLAAAAAPAALLLVAGHGPSQAVVALALYLLAVLACAWSTGATCARSPPRRCWGESGDVEVMREITPRRRRRQALAAQSGAAGRARLGAASPAPGTIRAGVATPSAPGFREPRACML